MSMDFTKLLDKTAAEIERPPLPPVGDYILKVTKQPAMEDSSDGAYTFVTFLVTGVSALETVDPEDLEKFGGAHNVAGTIRFLFDKQDATKFAQTEFRLKTFLTKHLLLDESLSLRELFSSCVGSEFVGRVGHRPDKNDPEIQYLDIRNVGPAE